MAEKFDEPLSTKAVHLLMKYVIVDWGDFDLNGSGKAPMFKCEECGRIGGPTRDSITHSTTCLYARLVNKSNPLAGIKMGNKKNVITAEMFEAGTCKTGT